MTSTELISQAHRRYDEMIKGRKSSMPKTAWTCGYIEGWMDGERALDNEWEASQFWQAKAESAERRAQELETLFALQQTRMAEAIRLWQESNNKPDILPDLGDLLSWLIRRTQEAEALNAELRRIHRDTLDAAFSPQAEPQEAKQ